MKASPPGWAVVHILSENISPWPDIAVPPPGPGPPPLSHCIQIIRDLSLDINQCQLVQLAVLSWAYRKTMNQILTTNQLHIYLVYCILRLQILCAKIIIALALLDKKKILHTEILSTKIRSGILTKAAQYFSPSAPC